MSNTPDPAPGDRGGAVPTRVPAPPRWDLFTAQHTSTPYAAYGSTDPTCLQFGCRYFTSTADRDQYLDAAHAADPHQSVYRWDLQRSTGRWIACPPATRQQDNLTLTDVLTDFAHRIVDGHPVSTATVGQLTLAAHTDPDPETDPAEDTADAYAYTPEAVAAFRRGDWSFTTVTLHLRVNGVRACAAQHGVDHGLAAPDDERAQLAGSLLPDLLTEAISHLRAAADAVEAQATGNPHEPGTRQRAIPATLTEDGEPVPVLAWIPTFATDDSAIAVGYRLAPDHAHAPYVVWSVQARPGPAGRYRIVDGRYDLEDLGEAMIEATTLAEQDTDHLGEDDHQRDHTPS